jgi:hypothetical protein
MARVLRVLLFTAIGIVLGAELLLRAFTVQPKLDCPDEGTVIVVAGPQEHGAALLQGCVDGDHFAPKAELHASSLVVDVPDRPFDELQRSPRLKVIAVHHGGVGASALLRGLDVLAPVARLRPWDYPDRDVRPLDLDQPKLEPHKGGGYVTFPLTGVRLDDNSHVTLIADAPREDAAKES